MHRSNWAALAALLAGAAFLAFLGIAVHELGYANAHPHRYGPVKAVGLTAVGECSSARRSRRWRWHSEPDECFAPS